MGYNVKKVPYKNGNGWKLQMIVYDRESIKGMKSERKIKDIPKQDWPQHGFSFDMSYEQAKAKQRSLNAQADVKRWGEKKARIRARLDQEETIECAFLPPVFVKEFEKDIFFEKIARGSEDVKFKNKVESHWRAVKRIIRKVSLPPKEWNRKSYIFYNEFIKHKMSPSYVQKVLRLLNEWGYFMAEKEDKAFLPIPSPRGANAQRIADAFFDKTPSGEGAASDPLTPAMLEKQKGNLLLDNYNWLYISAWFGLRPFEIDNLKKGKTWKLETSKRGRKVLQVYQPKLIRIPKPKRWKAIPIKYKEQEKALQMIMSGNFRRPIYKVMHNWFGEGITLYGSRKNFTDMMLEKGEKLEQISLWLGHRSIDRTWQDYKDRLNTDYEDAA